MIERLETTMKAGAVPQAPQFQQPILSTTANNVAYSGEKKEKKEEGESKPKVEEKPAKSGVPSTSAASTEPKPADALGDARSKVQEEITNEFAAIMASGTLRASEAAALATKRVMQRYGSTNSVQS